MTATKEVIISAGSYLTPQVLLQSGIGDPNELEEAGIEAIVDLPSVGKNLTDHVLLSMDWNVTGREVVNLYVPPYIPYTLPHLTVLYASSSNNETYQQDALEQWQTSRTGPLTNYGFSLISWSRLSDDWAGWGEVEDPSAGSNSPHFQVIPWSFGGAYPLSGPTVNTALLLLTSASRKCSKEFLSYWLVTNPFSQVVQSRSMEAILSTDL